MDKKIYEEGEKTEKEDLIVRKMNEIKRYKRGCKRKFNGWQVDAMKEMKKKGANYAQIGRKFNCAGNTVKYLIDGEFKKKQKEFSKRQRQKMKETERKPAKPAVEQFIGEKTREAFYKASLAKEINKINKANEITDEMKEAWLEKTVINRAIDRIIEIYNRLGLPKIVETIIMAHAKPRKEGHDNLIYAVNKRVINAEIGSVLNELGLRKLVEELLKSYLRYFEEEKAKR